MIGPEGWFVFAGDNRTLMANMGDCTVDSVVCDGPYELTSIVKRFGASDSAPAQFGTDGAYARASRGFMGQTWDGTGIVNDPTFWAEVLRVLKPGGWLVSFGGTRTYHRMACAVEDAGFEIRDMLEWIYGSGFPKGSVVDGWGPALKPAHEPICLARKPFKGSIADCRAAHGTGALNIDGCRIEATDGYCENAVTQGINTSRTSYAPASGRRTFVPAAGRFPANIIHDGSAEVLAGFPTAAGGGDIHQRNAPKTSGIYGAFSGGDDRWSGYGDSGSAARFFYCAKASKRDRDEGLDRHKIVSVSLGTWENAVQKVALRVDMAQSPPTVIGASTIVDLTAWSSALFGNVSEDQSPPDTTCTTKIETNSITLLKIWNCLQRFDTSANMADANNATEFGKNPAESADNGNRKIAIISEKTAFLLGVEPVASQTPLQISVSDGKSGHPTVKPTDLMRWLVRLVTPPGGLVFDPFTGSGSTGKAALLEGMRFIGAEMTPEYVPVARARIAWAARQPA